MYVAVKGGETAILNSYSLVEQARRAMCKSGEKAQIREQMASPWRE